MTAPKSLENFPVAGNAGKPESFPALAGWSGPAPDASTLFIRCFFCGSRPKVVYHRFREGPTGRRELMACYECASQYSKPKGELA